MFKIDEIYSIAISNDNRFLVTSCRDDSIKVFDLQLNQQILHRTDVHMSILYCWQITNL